MSSEWVKTELAKARKREVKEGKRVLFPVRLAPFEVLRDWECFDSDTGKDSAREVREYFIPDFSNWKDHDSYQAGLVASKSRSPAARGMTNENECGGREHAGGKRGPVRLAPLAQGRLFDYVS